MARMRMDDFIEHFSAELRSVLTRVLKEEAPDVDANRLFEAFKRAAKSSLGRRGHRSDAVGVRAAWCEREGAGR
jgi:hypothetical protein